MMFRNLLRFIALFWIVALVAGTFQYFSFPTNEGFLKLKQYAVKTGWYLPAFYCHIFGSSVILLSGFLQFSKKVYNNKILHKLLGKIYVFGVLFFAAPGAYVMTFFIHRGTGVFISFLLQNTLWVAFTLHAWLSIKKGKINDHVSMMHRSYAVAFAAITLRLYIWLFTILGNGVNFNNNYLIIAFVSWVPNLMLVEIINYYNKKKLTWQ